MFRTVPLPITRSFSLYTQQWYMSYRCADSLWAGSEWNAVPSWSCSQAVSKPVWHIPLPRVQWKTPGDGQRKCPKHVEFHSKEKIWVIGVFSWFYYKGRPSTNVRSCWLLAGLTTPRKSSASCLAGHDFKHRPIHCVC